MNDLCCCSSDTCCTQLFRLIISNSSPSLLLYVVWLLNITWLLLWLLQFCSDHKITDEAFHSSGLNCQINIKDSSSSGWCTITPSRRLMFYVPAWLLTLTSTCRVYPKCVTPYFEYLFISMNYRPENIKFRRKKKSCFENAMKTLYVRETSDKF